MKQYTIQLRVDFPTEDDKKHAAVAEAVRQVAGQLLTLTTLISSNISPQVVAFSDDWFTGKADIALIAAEDDDGGGGGGGGEVDTPEE